MDLYKFIKKFISKNDLKKIPKPGKFLDSGSFGSVYYFPVNKIIKFSKIEGRHLANLFETFQKIKDTNAKCVSKIYDFGYIGMDLKSYHYFYYITEKLEKLESSRNKVHSMGTLYNTNELPAHMEKLNKNEKLFVKELSKLKRRKLIHYDFQLDNIMQTKSGKLKVIDLESFYEFY
jgi:thiamine kinase-like enzyme